MVNIWIVQSLVLTTAIFLHCFAYGVDGNKLRHRNATITSKLHRGYTTRRGDYSFTVWIETGKRKYHCGASLIDTDWVLTAASCLQDRDLEAYTFVVGDYKPRKQGDGEIRVSADRIILHPVYASGIAGNDIALVHLSEKIKKNTGITPLSQMFAGELADIEINNRRCVLTGWGRKSNGKMNKKLQFLPVTMADDVMCSTIATFGVNSSLCFSGDPGAPCESDMGSPIVCEVDEEWVQVAVHTTGTCKAGYQVAAQVSPMNIWIKNIQVNNYCGDPPFINNGRFVPSGFNVEGDEAVLVCNTGFRRTVTSDRDATITCQIDSTWSTTNAVCVKDCSNPPFVSNGRFALVPGTSVAVLECNTGYNPSSESGRTIVCQDNGQWSSTIVTCVRDTTQGCGDPPSLSNGQFVLVDGSNVNSAAVLVCNSGYRPSSESGRTIVCQQNGQWSSTSVQCIRETQACGTPPFISNGEFVLVDGGDVNDVAVLVCDQNYRPSSESGRTIICQSNGQWGTTSTTCVRDNQGCGDPPFIANGNFVLIGGTTVAVLECNFGFRPSTESGRTIICQDNGQWSYTGITCVRETQGCGSPPFVSNGQFTEVPGSNVAVLECDTNYRPSSESGRTIVCQDNGQWSSTGVTCIRDVQGCGDPPPVTYGQFVPYGNGFVNDQAVLVCDSGYQPSSMSDRVIVCQDNGQWSRSDTTCVRETQGCGNPPYIDNGNFMVIGGTNVAVLECNSSYRPSSEADRYIVCQKNGRWSSTGVTCQRNTQGCGNPPFVSNGQFTQVPSSNVAILECNTNYRPSSESGRTIVCQDNGQWSSTGVSCVRENQGCGSPPYIAYGRFVLVDGAPDVAILSCNSGYRPSSESGRNIYCQQNGQWSTTGTTCVRETQSCGSPPFINNGRFVLVDGAPNVAVLECNPGYQPSLESERTLVCLDNGQWSSSSGVQCVRSTQGCGYPPYIDNGQFVQIDDNSVNAKAVLVCNSGYRPSSESGRTIFCQQNGQWSSTNVVCVRDSQGCGSPPYIANGQFVLADTNDRAVLVCNPGFQPSSEAGRTIYCQQNRQWSSTSTTCIRTRQGCGSRGTSFILGFPKSTNGRGTPYLFTLTTERTTVVVTTPYFSKTISYDLVRVAIWFFDPDIMGRSPEEVNRKGIQIESQRPITVIAHQYEPGSGPSADGTLIHPEYCASTEYIVVTHDKSASSKYRPNIMITGTTSNTYVVLELTNGQQKSVTLGRYGTYYYSGSYLIGARVRASSRVVVLAGHECANVPSANVERCDHLLEQMPPISSLQRTYILTFMKPRPYYSVRIVAIFSNTVVTIRDRFGKVLKTYQLNRNSNVFVNVINSFTISIISNNNILVAQLGQGTAVDNLRYGDPSMVVHPSVNQFENFYQLFLPTEFYSQHWAVITIRESDNIGGLRLNNQLFQAYVTSVYVPTDGNFKVAHVQLYDAYYTLSHVNGNKFGVFQYGFNAKVEYAWMSGRLF